MKVIVTENAKPAREYPRLVRTETSGVVILALTSTSGVVLSVDPVKGSYLKYGELVGFDTRGYLDFEGVVTLDGSQ